MAKQSGKRKRRVFTPDFKAEAVRLTRALRGALAASSGGAVAFYNQIVSSLTFSTV